MTDQSGYRWKILVATYLASFSFGMTLQNIPPVIPLLINEFGLVHAQAGLAMSLFALPMIFLSIPAGLLADRWGPKTVGLTAFAFALAGNLLVAFSAAFPVLLAGRALAGMGAFTLVMISPQFISQWFSPREVGRAMGIWNTAFPLATIVSFVSLGSVGQVMGWRGSVLVATALVASAMIVFWLLAKPAPITPAERHAGAGSVLEAIRGAGRSIWLVGAAWLCFNAATLSFTAFGQDYFQSVGFPVALAGVLSSMMLWGTFVAAPVVGIMLDRGMRNETLMIAGCFGLAVSLFLVPAGVTFLVPVLLFGAVAGSLIVVSIFSLPPRLLKPHVLGLGFGILSTCLNTGTAIGPLVVGAARDISGSYTTAFWAMSLMALLISVAAASLAVSRNRARAERVHPK